MGRRNAGQPPGVEVVNVKRRLRVHQIPEDELIQLAEGGYFNSNHKEVLGVSFATFTSFLIVLLTCHGIGPYLFATFFAVTFAAGLLSAYFFMLVRTDGRRVKDYVKSIREAPEI